MPNALSQVERATRGTPFEGRLWLVGGAVRDDLLGREHPPDLDLLVEGDALAAARLLWDRKVAAHPPVVYPRFGTAMVSVAGVNLELATARRESYDPASRKPSVRPATLEEDALRRDFTVNTLLHNLHTGELRDPLGLGLNDLKAGVLRTPLDAAATFRDDPLRMLRAVRFAHHLAFRPAEGLYEAIRGERERLRIISQERIRDELLKMLGGPDPVGAMRDLMDVGLLEEFAPEFMPLVGLEQGRYHCEDGWDHTLTVLGLAAELSPTLEVRLAALLHDIGKPATRFVDEHGNTRFLTHEVVGAEMAEAMLRRLRVPGDLADPVVLLVRHHSRLGTAPTFTPTAARRLLRDLGEWVDPLLLLVDADQRAHRTATPRCDLDSVRRVLHEVRQATPRETLRSPLSGEDIIAATGLAEHEIDHRYEVTGHVLDADRRPRGGWARDRPPERCAR